MSTFFLDESPDRFQRFVKSAAPGVTDALGNFMQRKREMNAQAKQQSLLEHQAEALGLPKEVLDPSLQRALLDQRGSPESHQFDEQSYQTISKRFGQDAADLYRSATEGGKTSVLNKLLENEQRSKELGDTLNSPTVEGEYRLDTKGMTPKERVDYKAQLRKSNEPIWKESKDKLKSHKELNTDIKILRGLNEKKNLPEGFQKLLINPETGAPYEQVNAIKNMHPDVQRWVKTIARQATQAQSAFPGRVTNFDLQSYMRQFPSLFNTYEGRKIILDQMELSNKANELFEDALNKVYSRHKLSGITPEDAQIEAEKMVGNEIEEINQKLVNLAEEGEIIAEPSGNVLEQSESGQRVDVYDAQGNLVGDIDASEVDQLPQGYKIK